MQAGDVDLHAIDGVDSQSVPFGNMGHIALEYGHEGLDDGTKSPGDIRKALRVLQEVFCILWLNQCEPGNINIILLSPLSKSTCSSKNQGDQRTLGSSL